MPEKEDWTKWHNERGQFLARETEGFTKDLEALEKHIKALTQVCPKDKAGFPVTNALIHIGRLTKFYNQVKEYLNLNR